MRDLTLAILFIAGAGNFAMHRWMLESGHPVVDAATGGMRRTLGRHVTYVIEFALLVLAMTLARHWWFATLMGYVVYTAMNAATVAWLKGPRRG